MNDEVRDLLQANGEIGHALLEVDWSATALGDPTRWPRSLRWALQVMLTSRFAMWMAWGPELTFFCNEPYRRQTLGSKYPWALGRPASEVWAEIWPEIGPRIGHVLQSGEATWDESLPLILERSGFPEETYHTFSYSPLADDDNHVAGMLCVVSEDTERAIGERQMRILRELASALAETRTDDEVGAAAVSRLGEDLRTLPFSLIYLIDERREVARLAASAGVAAGHPVAPELVPLSDVVTPWPLAEVALGATAVVEHLNEHFFDVPTGGWPEPVEAAIAMPLAAQPGEPPLGVFVAGLNRYRRLDESYRGFLGLIARQLAASFTNARAYQAERRRAEALEQLDRAKTAFFTNVSHEFRTPLTLMLGPAADALSDELVDPKQRTRFELIHRNGERLLKLVNSLLDFSRAESGRVAPRVELVDLSSYTEELASLFAPAVAAAGLEFVVECPPLGAEVYVDPEMWATVVSNLVSNALKFTFEGSIHLELSLRGEGDSTWAELAVHDTGIGVAPEDQVHLFERFYRVEGARSRSIEGSGIGLAHVADLVGLHGGQVEATSSPDVGSTFVVRVPVGAARPDDVPRREPPASLPSPEALAAGSVREAMRWLEAADLPVASADGVPRARVLVAEDNPDMRRYIASLLAEQYEVELADDGAVALELARDHPPELVLTDVMMPNLGGFDLLAALRADPATSHVPVVMLSARAGEEAAIEGLDAGADDYLIKPFSALELVARVRSALELERSRRAMSEQERRIANELQRSLIPSAPTHAEGLMLATRYEPRADGAQVGGDWYDVIDLGAGQTALVIGDVMGRGIPAASVMGQVRSALRAYAMMGLEPAEVLDATDAMVRDLAGSQLVTCLYAIYDAFARTLTYANAGHLPPLVASPRGPAVQLAAATRPPLGAGPIAYRNEVVALGEGSTVVFYTDGLVEKRGADLGERIAQAVAALQPGPRPEASIDALVAALAADGGEDDLAVLVAQLPPAWEVQQPLSLWIEGDPSDVAIVRRSVLGALGDRVAEPLRSDLALLVSELTTNGVLHGRSPIEVRLALHPSALLFEVLDQGHGLPRLLHPAPDARRGRGLRIVDALASRWGVKRTPRGKSTWCTIELASSA